MQAGKTVGLRILHAGRLLRKSFDRQAGKFGLTRAQWQAVVVINRSEGMSQRELATALEIGEVAAGQLAERLQRDGWISREPDPADRRANKLVVNPVAVQSMNQLLALGGKQEERALAGLSGAEQAALAKALDTIIDNLNEALDDRGLVDERAAAPASA